MGLKKLKSMVVPSWNQQRLINSLHYDIWACLEVDTVRPPSVITKNLSSLQGDDQLQDSTSYQLWQQKEDKFIKDKLPRKSVTLRIVTVVNSLVFFFCCDWHIQIYLSIDALQRKLFLLLLYLELQQDMQQHFFVRAAGHTAAFYFPCILNITRSQSL